jgi:hypothetical protein
MKVRSDNEYKIFMHFKLILNNFISFQYFMHIKRLIKIIKFFKKM